jgi:small ligand-binding sensory domain FIST
MLTPAQSRAAIAEDSDWQPALDRVLADVKSAVPIVDLAFLFANSAFAQDFPTIARRTLTEIGATTLIGCSGQGVIGPMREVEGPPAISLMGMSLPGANLRSVRIEPSQSQSWTQPEDWHRGTDVPPSQVNAWLLFVDPFRMDVDGLVKGLSAAYPGTPVLGGLASGNPHARQTFVFLDGESYADGAVAVAIGGAYTVKSIVSQGAEPISMPWTITDAQGHIIKSIGMRPAFEVLKEALESLPEEKQRRAQRNLLVGLAIDERRDEFRRGDFLIRNLMGADQKSGAIAVGAYPKVGQTIQFQVRDGEAADQELQLMLTRARDELGGKPPVAAVVCSCNGRGVSLFGIPDHDAKSIAENLGVTSMAGFFCNGEIGPIGNEVFVHGYTASIALIVPA